MAAREAILYSRIEGGKVVRCHLCAHRCKVLPGKRGICRVRENRDGTLYSLSYGRVVAENIDPIEKKPLYHFYPGSLSYSIATAGCNLSCSHCQNYTISIDAARMTPLPGRDRGPGDIVAGALAAGCPSISYTYTEPTVYFEFAKDCGAAAREAGIANVFVTNGFMTPETIAALTPWLDAANVDLKGATEDHYRSVCRASLRPVLDSITALHGAGVWIEITTLLIPGVNDDEASLATMAEFIASLDPLVPWHVSRFFPAYRMTDRPPTPLASLKRAEAAGHRAGLKNVYLGNIDQEESDTACHSCGHILIRRSGYSVIANEIDPAGLCPSCSTPFAGRLAPR